MRSNLWTTADRASCEAPAGWGPGPSRRPRAAPAGDAAGRGSVRARPQPGSGLGGPPAGPPARSRPLGAPDRAVTTVAPRQIAPRRRWEGGYRPGTMILVASVAKNPFRPSSTPPSDSAAIRSESTPRQVKPRWFTRSNEINGLDRAGKKSSKNNHLAVTACNRRWNKRKPLFLLSFSFLLFWCFGVTR